MPIPWVFARLGFPKTVDELLPALNRAFQGIEVAFHQFRVRKLSDINDDLGTITVDAAHLATSSVGASAIINDAISAAHLQAGAVVTSAIAAGAVVTSSLAADAIIASKIAAGAVVTSALAADAVTADKVAANSIAVEQLFVGSLDNLVMNPGAEQSASSIDPHQDLPASGASFAVVTTNARSGSHAFQFSQGSAVSGNSFLVFNGTPANVDLHIAAADGDQFYAEVFVRKVGAGTAPPTNLLLDFRNRAGAQLSFFQAGAITPTTTYQKLSLSATAPAGTAYVIAYPLISFASGATELVNIDDAYMRRMVTGSIVVDGTIEANHLAVDSVTASSIAAQAITTSAIAAGAVTADKISANSITADKILASSIITTKLEAGAVTNAKINLTKTTEVLSSGTSWTVPANFNPYLNSIELIAGGGGGTAGVTNTRGGGGGGGGGRVRLVNFDPAGEATIPYAIGAAGGVGTAGGNTSWLNGMAVATGGGAAVAEVGGAGGSGTAGLETMGGGSGGNGSVGTGTRGGGGGGGAAGPHTGGSNGSNAAVGTGGAGGNGGDPNGGAGGAASSNGGAGTTWGSAGPGGGGGGGSGLAGGQGGNYGAGGGGGGSTAGVGQAPGTPGAGVIVITYYAIPNS